MSDVRQPPEPPSRVGVLGAGTMGAGIALCFALAGADATVNARRAESLTRARAQVDASIALLIGHGRIDDEAATAARGRIAYTEDAVRAVADADLVVETVVEQLDVKQALLERVSAAAPREAVIATNTSSLPLEQIAASVAEPARFAGLHWFNPPELVELVEVVAAPATSPDTIERLMAWSLAAGKRPVRLERPIAGFVANRLQYALLREAYALVESGVCDTAAVDTAVTAGIGARWAAVGPFESMDLAGLDVHLEVARQLFPELANAGEAPARLRDAVATGRLGVKSGHGLRGRYDAAHVAELADRRARILLDLAGDGESAPAAPTDSSEQLASGTSRRT